MGCGASQGVANCPKDGQKVAVRTLFARLGGAITVTAAVDIFYTKVLADPKLSPFFEGVDMYKLKKHQISFMMMAFGGGNRYTGRDIQAAHAHVVRDKGLTVEHFDLVVKHLVASFKQLKVAGDLLTEVLAILGPLRRGFDAQP